MTDYTELKRLAEGAVHAGDHWGLRDSFERQLAKLVAPETVLALIADLDEALNGMKHSCAIRLKKQIEQLETERDQLKAENEAALREATDLAMAIWRRCYAKDSPNFQPFEKASSVIGQIDNMAAGLMSDLEKLRAEVAGLRTGYQAYERVNAELKAEVEGLRKDRTDWQAECLKRGFEYVRESDDHYVLADVPEMADLLGALLGVEVRSKENDAYEEANSRLNEQIEGLINTIHRQESTRISAELLEPVTGDQLPAIGSEVLIHLASCDSWVKHTVAGYYAWGDLHGDESLHRLFVRVRDADGYLNARLLKDVRIEAAMDQGEQS